MVSESKKITQMFLFCMRHSMRKQTPLSDNEPTSFLYVTQENFVE